MFIVKKTNNERPFNVVYVNDSNIHYQPGCSFSTKELAEMHLNVLVNSISTNGNEFILNHWPVMENAE